MRRSILENMEEKADRALRENELNRQVSANVNARAQSHAAGIIEQMLTEQEADIYRRGRNAKSATSPKNMDIADYRRATEA